MYAHLTWCFTATYSDADGSCCEGHKRGTHMRSYDLLWKSASTGACMNKVLYSYTWWTILWRGKAEEESPDLCMPSNTHTIEAYAYDQPLLVMEYLENGSLHDILHNKTLVIDGDLLMPILCDIVQGMRYLHSAKPQQIHGVGTCVHVCMRVLFCAWCQCMCGMPDACVICLISSVLLENRVCHPGWHVFVCMHSI